MDKVIYHKYARVLLKAGVQFKMGQNLFVTAPLESCKFVRILAAEAYENFGAAYVKVFYKDDEIRNARINYSQEKYLSRCPQWEKEYNGAYSKEDCCAINLISGSFSSAEKSDTAAFKAVVKAEAEEMELYLKNLDDRRISWTIAAYPTLQWAKNVYPESEDEEALKALWRDFIKIYKLDEIHPDEEWEHCRDNLKALREKLNSMSITALALKSDTMDLKMTLCNGSWRGGSAETYDKKTEFMGNIPTHEVFHVPNKYKVDGFVKSTMPLNYNGKVIEGIYLRFKDGRVTDFKADKNEDILDFILHRDKGSDRLGEIGLVSTDESEIYKTGKVFFTTLFDENAVTHLALGAGCESVIDPTGNLSDEKAEAYGVNKSALHVDFMVGSESLTVTAFLSDGSRTDIMQNGKFTV